MSTEKSSTSFRVSEKKPEKHYYCSKAELRPIKTQISDLQPFKEHNCTELIQTSKFPKNTHISKNGFVNTLIDAYNYHHNLIIRPDDIWAAIMTQFSFYINKHAEDFRGKFVDFEGKKQLTVASSGSLTTAP